MFQNSPSLRINRRRHDRFELRPMYAGLVVRVLEVASGLALLDGHAYDISMGGVQLEIDHPIEPGTEVSVEIAMPHGRPAPAIGPKASSEMEIKPIPGLSVLGVGRVVWVSQDEPGPVRLAVAFREFPRLGDAQRLAEYLGSGRYSRAA